MTSPSDKLLEAASPRVNALVSASAGTGKTWLLVARLLRLLLDGEPPASILAITFTRKAAAEVRERLDATLREWTRLDDAALREALAAIGVRPGAVTTRARELYETLTYAESGVRVLTFHSFCAEILERFAFEAGVPPGFEICSDEAEPREEALHRLYVETAEAPAGDVAAVLATLFETCGGLTNVNRALENFLTHRNDWLSYVEGASDPVRDAILRLGEMLGVNPEEAEDNQGRCSMTLDEKTRALLETHAQLLALHDTATNRKYAAAITAFLATGAEEMDDAALAPLLKCFFNADGGVREKAFSSGAFRRALGDDFEAFDVGRGTLVEILAEAKDALLRRRNFLRNRAWYVVGQRLIEIYRECKLARRQLDFDDLEWFACRLINREDDAQWIQYRLNERIRHVLVDEFQDTNPQQWQLLKPLLEEMASKEDGGSAFIVGDVKQSIYGFRRANPELQNRARRWMERHVNGRLYTADASRRSSPEVIAFVNRVFSGGEEEAPTPADFRPHTTRLDVPGGVTVLPFCKGKGRASEPAPKWRRILRDPPRVDDDPPACEEGRRIAECIVAMIEQRVAVHDRDGNVRPLRFGDVTLLVRKRTHLRRYERALTRAGVPHAGGRAEGPFDSPEVADLVALIEFLLNPARNLDLARVLRSPLFAVGDEQLIALSQAAKDGERDWFESLEQLRADAGLRRAHDLLGDWIEIARVRLPVHDLLDRVYRDGDVLRRCRAAAGDEADEIERNLIELLDYSLEFESGRYPDLARFARHLKRQVARAKSPQAASASAGDAADDPERVRILTIHQAKGLEAPVVVLADCGRPRPPPGTYGVLADWLDESDRPEHFLLVPKGEDLDAFTADCKARLGARDAREEERLLYVALTRARQYLVISGSGDDSAPCWYARLAACAEQTTTIETYPRDSRHPPGASFPRRRQKGGMASSINRGEAAPYSSPPQVAPAKLEIRPSALVETPPPEPARGASDDDDNARRGQVIHCALKLLSERIEEAELRAALAACFPEAPEARGTPDAMTEWIEHARAVVADEALRELFDDARYEQTLNEAPIAFLDGDDQYFGVMDRVCVARDSVWLVDYKTHRLPDDRIEVLKARYAGQMRAYHLGAEKLWPGRAVRASLLFTEPRRLVDYRF